MIARWPGKKKLPWYKTDFNVSKACREWFEKCQKRSGINSVIRHGEAGSNAKAAEEFVKEFDDLVKGKVFLPHYVFNYHECKFIFLLPTLNVFQHTQEKICNEDVFISVKWVNGFISFEINYFWRKLLFCFQEI